MLRQKAKTEPSLPLSGHDHRGHVCLDKRSAKMTRLQALRKIVSAKLPYMEIMSIGFHIVFDAETYCLKFPVGFQNGISQFGKETLRKFIQNEQKHF